MVPALLVALAASFSPRRHRLYPPVALAAGALIGLCVAVIQLIAASRGVSQLFPTVLLVTIYIYFMGSLLFYHSVAANVLVATVYLSAGTALQLPGLEFGFDAISLVAVNIFCASVAYTHEKTSRIRFLEAALLREMVARDGLTGIQNRRMFDVHIQQPGTRPCATGSGSQSCSSTSIASRTTTTATGTRRATSACGRSP